MADEEAAFNLSLLWMLGAAGFIFLGLVRSIQVGVSLMEVGITRPHAIDEVMVRNVVVISLGVLTWWVLGYAFSFGHPSDFIGEQYYAGDKWEGQPDYAMALAYGFIGMYILLLIKGAHAERGGFIPQLIFTFIVTWFVWPVIVAWSWGGAWLDRYFDEPFLDVGGGATIHTFAGVMALISVLILGRRKGFKDSADLHSLHLDFKPTSQVLILTGGLLEMIAIVYINALNAPSLIASGTAFFNTWLAGGAAGITAYLLGTLGNGEQLDYVLCILKGTVSGMVMVSSFSQNIVPWEAFVHGFTGGVLFAIIKKLEDRFLLDDPLKVVPAHLLPGVWGCVGAAFWHADQGVYHQDVSGAQIGYQLAGVVCIMVWAAIWGAILFGVFKLFEPRAPKQPADLEKEDAQPLDYQEEGPQEPAAPSS